MNAQERIREALGELRSPSWVFGQSRSGAMEAGTTEARLSALEDDVSKLRDALLVAAAEIDRVASAATGN